MHERIPFNAQKCNYVQLCTVQLRAPDDWSCRTTVCSTEASESSKVVNLMKWHGWWRVCVYSLKILLLKRWLLVDKAGWGKPYSAETCLFGCRKARRVIPIGGWGLRRGRWWWRSCSNSRGLMFPGERGTTWQHLDCCEKKPTGNFNWEILPSVDCWPFDWILKFARLSVKWS